MMINISSTLPPSSLVNDTLQDEMFYATTENSTSEPIETSRAIEHQIEITWPGICLIVIFCVFIVITTIGNTLVILAVITTRRLRTVTNCFVMSLAIADFLVGLFVMPPAVAVHLIGTWQLGWVLCDIWISLDVLLCTASILSLCAISVDRYLAVTQPLTYSRKRRSKRLALIMILVVWTLALAITCPPILGWYEPGRRDDITECRYNQNEGYVVFSAMGSFFIPMAVMIYVYARISCVVASRHDNMTDIEVHNKKCKRHQNADVDLEPEQDTSEQDHTSPNQKKQQAARTLSNQGSCGGGGGGGGGGKEAKDHQLQIGDNELARQYKNGNYELVTASRSSSFKRQSSITAKNSSPANDHWQLGQHQTQHHQQQQQQLHPGHHPVGQHRQSVRHQQNATSTATSTTAAASYNETCVRNTRVHQKSLSNRITSLKRENKTTQTLSIVVGGFIACWLPFFINYLVTPFISADSVSPNLAEFLTWLGWFNSAINPFIYAFYSVDFRAAFWRLTFKRFFKNSNKGQFPSNTMSIRR